MVATQYLQPFAAMMICLFGGWAWSRSAKLAEIEQGDADFKHSLLGKVWPIYVKVVCPILVGAIIWASFF
jgi:NSS family neurotransmitter:Na+ symporter